jgi:hypothetical protein
MYSGQKAQRISNGMIHPNACNKLLYACLICFLVGNFVKAQNRLQPIGNWREHLPYQHCIQVVNGDKIYAATDEAVFSVSADQLSRYTKVTGLNDIGVAAIAWDNETAQLVIAYTNSNVDILKGAIVNNIGDIKRSTITANKTINQIFCDNGIAYLSAGLGVIIADLHKFEIKDTWYLGSNGSQVNVNAFMKDAQYFYAATDEGLKIASQQSQNLSSPSSWQNMSGSGGLSTGSINNIVTLNNKLVVQKKDSLFIQNNSVWTLLYADSSWPIINLNSNGAELEISQRKNDGSSRILIVDDKGNRHTIGNPNTTLGHLMNGAIIGYSTNKETPKYQIIEDKHKLHGLNQKDDNPIPLNGGTESGNPELNSLNTIIF